MQKMALVPFKSPCDRKCKRRSFDCHGKCKEYAEYRAKCDKLINERMLESDVKHAIGDAMKRIPGKREI